MLDAGHLGRGAFGKEDVAQRLRLLGIAQHQEGRALLGQAVGETGFCRKAHQPDRFGRRDLSARFGKDLVGQRIDIGTLADGDGKLAGAARRRDDQSSRGGDRLPGEVAVGHLVDDAERQRFLGADDAPGRDHLRRGQRAGQPRQALRAARARNDAELHFGQADPGRLRRDPVVAGQRDLAAAAERHAVERRDNRLVARLDQFDDLRQGRLGHRLAELADVGAADEAAPAADDDDRADLFGDAGMHDGAVQPGPHGCRRRVDRRVVDGDDEDAVLHAIGDGIGKPGARGRRLHLTAFCPHQSGTTAIAWISTLARSSISATTCTAAIAGKCRPITSR